MGSGTANSKQPTESIMTPIDRNSEIIPLTPSQRVKNALSFQNNNMSGKNYKMVHNELLTEEEEEQPVRNN